MIVKSFNHPIEAEKWSYYEPSDQIINWIEDGN